VHIYAWTDSAALPAPPLPAHVAPAYTREGERADTRASPKMARGVARKYGDKRFYLFRTAEYGDVKCTASLVRTCGEHEACRAFSLANLR